jgi:ATP-dependent DNA ligase
LAAASRQGLSSEEPWDHLAAPFTFFTFSRLAVLQFYLVPSEKKCRKNGVIAWEANQAGRTLITCSTERPFFAEICTRDLEGIVAKRKLGIYKDDAPGWLKLKNPTYSQVEGRHELLTRGR